MTRKTALQISIPPLILLLIALAGWAGWTKFQVNRTYTVAEAWEKAQNLSGRQITVEGPTRFEISQTEMLCCPPRCDCNLAYGHLYLVSESPVHYNLKNSSIDYIEVAVDCSGSDCSVTCTPFDPRSIDRLRITGTLVGYGDAGGIHNLNLNAIDLSASRQLVDDAWKPIPTGTFVIPRTRATPPPGLCPSAP